MVPGQLKKVSTGRTSASASHIKASAPPSFDGYFTAKPHPKNNTFFWVTSIKNGAKYGNGDGTWIVSGRDILPHPEFDWNPLKPTGHADHDQARLYHSKVGAWGKWVVVSSPVRTSRPVPLPGQASEGWYRGKLHPDCRSMIVTPEERFYLDSREGKRRQLDVISLSAIEGGQQVPASELSHLGTLYYLKYGGGKWIMSNFETWWLEEGVKRHNP